MVLGQITRHRSLSAALRDRTSTPIANPFDAPDTDSMFSRKPVLCVVTPWGDDAPRVYAWGTEREGPGLTAENAAADFFDEAAIEYGDGLDVSAPIDPGSDEYKLVALASNVQARTVADERAFEDFEHFPIERERGSVRLGESRVWIVPPRSVDGAVIELEDHAQFYARTGKLGVHAFVKLPDRHSPDIDGHKGALNKDFGDTDTMLAAVVTLLEREGFLR